MAYSGEPFFSTVFLVQNNQVTTFGMVSTLTIFVSKYMYIYRNIYLFLVASLNFTVSVIDSLSGERLVETYL